MVYVENTEQQEKDGAVMQMQTQSDLERANELVQAIFGSDTEAYEAFMQTFEDDYDNDVERLIAICDKAMVICTNPNSPYCQFALRRRLMVFAGEIASTKDTDMRSRHLNVCAEYLRSRLSDKSLAKGLVNTLFHGVVSEGKGPVAVIKSIIMQLPEGPQSELFNIKRRYLGFGPEPVLENEPS